MNSRVLIIDDQLLFADAIRVSLEDAGFHVLGVVPSGERGLALALADLPDVVLIDVKLPDRSGLEVGAEILRRLPETKVVAVTALRDRGVADDALDLGFHGYLTKDTSVSRLVGGIEAVLDGQVVMLRPVTHSDGNGRPEDVELLARQLTSREMEVLGLLVEGLSGVEIARRLRISRNTVRTHVQAILTKLQLHSRLEAAAFALRYGLVGSRLSVRTQPLQR